MEVVNSKGKAKSFLFLLNSDGVLPITIHKRQDISIWNGNDDLYLRFTADEFSQIQERLRVGREVYLPLYKDCEGKYCNNNQLFLDWLNGYNVKFNILEGRCYLNSNHVE